MSISTNKQAALGATLLAISSAALAKGGDTTMGSSAGKSQIGVNHLSLEEMPGKYATVCTNSMNSTGEVSSKSGSNMTANDLTVQINTKVTAMEMVFSVSDVIANDQDQVLLLVYSTGLSPTPQIPTDMSEIKLGIDTTRAEIASIYNIPSQKMLAQPNTRIGQSRADAHSKVSFTVNLTRNQLQDLVNTGRSTMYAQAALVRRVDFDAGNYQNMILSEVDKITFTDTTCTSVKGGTTMVNDGSSLTITDSTGTVGKTQDLTVTSTATSTATSTTSVKVFGK